MPVRLKLGRSIGLGLLLLWCGLIAWHTHKPLLPGVHVRSSEVSIAPESVRFLSDLTWHDQPSGQRHSQQQIFDAVLAQIDAAQQVIVLDFFLFNDSMGRSTQAPLRALSHELMAHLLARKQLRPTLQILLITDPINDAYGGAPSPLLAQLQAAGIDVVRTNLNALRDSNAGYSAFWRMGPQWLGNSAEGGWLPNPFDQRAAPITLRSWLALLNFKANHRKVLVSDNAEGQWQAILTSGNPHDASSAHSNVALQFSGHLAEQVLHSELDIARFSGWRGNWSLPTLKPQPTLERDAPGLRLEYVTEGAIHERVLAELGNTKTNDEIQLAMFYLSDRKIISALKQAAQRGVRVRLVLDPNKDAFGIKKDGVPNRPVAHELLREGTGRIAVRWYATQGEQFHTKLLLIKRGDVLFAALGSANFTRRNLADYNLEANVTVVAPASSALAVQLNDYFNRLWQGDAASTTYTLPASAYVDDSRLRYWRYRLMEATGLSTF